ncbi:centromere/kinetochore protein zw10 homolog [Leptidea sinapis]|uniref:centromere/kinetochore protein zw10 homolog n=1 Tax=Leptidea sinapis TaxID=189913 RepID=UPI0021250964|nr:centromere/kinetochore protein zw10 homolog [Leptidea sinapis]
MSTVSPENNTVQPNKDYKKQKDQLLTKIRELTEKIQLLSFALHQNIVDLYLNFTPTKSLEQLNYKNRKANIYNEYETIQKDVSSFENKFKTEEFLTYFKKLNDSQKHLQNLCDVAEGKYVLDKAHHEIERYNYSEAILTVKQLLDKLLLLKFESNLAKALTNMISQAENQIAIYKAQLNIEWEEIFTWTEQRGVNQLTYSLTVQQSDLILIKKILRSLFEAECLNAELGLFSDFFINKLLHNVIRHNCDIFTDDHVGALVFNIKIDLSDQSKPNLQTIVNNLTAVFEFLQSTLGSLLETETTFIEIFAKSIKTQFFSKIIEDCIRNNLPSCESSYENYKNIVIELESFNKFLVDLKFVEANKSPLDKYINDTECVLYNKKCDKLLADVRQLMNQSLSYQTLTVGTVFDTENESLLDVTQRCVAYDLSNPLFLPKCVISQNVKKIMTIITEHLEECVKLPEKYSNKLVTYIKKIAVMYQSIVPYKFKVNLECCPLDIALFFNNCFYLAHSLLGPPWKNTLPAPLADFLNLTLLECIQDLRIVGLEKISIYLQSRKKFIIEQMETNELPWTLESYDTFNFGVNSSLRIMKELKSNWYNILPHKMYELALCTLVQALCQSMVGRIFAESTPVSEKLVYTLANRFIDTAEEIKCLFEDHAVLENKVEIWKRFAKMPQLLKAQMLEIAEMWNSCKELSESYICEEIRHIVKIRFPDNKYRLNILKEIQ